MMRSLASAADDTMQFCNLHRPLTLLAYLGSLGKEVRLCQVEVSFQYIPIA